MPNAYYKPSRKCGLTLIEVVVSIGLLTTLLVGVLMSLSRHAEQIERSRERQQALRAADKLLYAWARDLNRFPRESSGETGESNLLWKTQIVSQGSPTRLGLEVVQVNVSRKGDAKHERPLVRVQVILPSASWPPQMESNDASQ